MRNVVTCVFAGTHLLLYDVSHDLVILFNIYAGVRQVARIRSKPAGGPRAYSQRKAVIGSIAVARRAGM
jgi:hypothetical protein